MSSISGSNPYTLIYQTLDAGKTDGDKSKNPLTYQQYADHVPIGDQPQSGNDVLIATPIDDQPESGDDVLIAGQDTQRRIDNENRWHNPLDQSAGEDAEVFDPNTQSWQPTRPAGNGQYAPLGDPYREAIDFEIKADDMGGWTQV